MTKQYSKRSINGDAGEHFAAFFFTRALKWPCRLQDVDIGVDAELEICDYHGASTGNVVKLQIKSFENLSSVDKHHVYVDESDMLYWKRFSVPTIAVCVDLSGPRVFWKAISATEPYLSGGESRKITFDLRADLLVEASGEAIAKLAAPDNFKDVLDLVEQARSICTEVTSSAAVAISEDELAWITSKNERFDLLLSRIEEIRRHYPWRIGEFAAVEVEKMKQRMFRHLNDAEISYNIGVNGM